MTRLTPVPAVLVTLASVVAGLLFAPVFGVWPLVLPLLVPAAVSLAIAVVVSHREALVPWRPVLALLGGLLGVVETMLWSTTVAGLPTGSTARALGSGITSSWQLALQSTWPARPEPALMLFVPLLVLLASVLGVELLHRWGALPALAPGFAVLVLSQFYSAATGLAAVLAALAYAAAAGALLMATRPERGSPGRRLSSGLLLATPAVVLAAIGALLGALVLPGEDARYTLRDEQFAPLTASNLTNPLDMLSYRLAHPGVPVFTVDGDGAVDRWPVVVLSGFDGVNWTPGSAYRRLGSALAPSPDVAVEVEWRTARISGARLDGPWLPSQPSPAAVGGIRPLVEERQGSLLAPDAPRPASYTLSWWEPQVDRDDLVNAAIDRDVAAGMRGGVGQVPEGIAELADRAVPARPTFRTAVALADFLRTEYRLATGQNLPTGHSWAQLREFLLDSKRGTSEQFAAAYVALARMKGIPARLVVGFRAPADREGGRYTVRNGDALAWPEVAVEGVGWVPLDPSGSAGAVGAVPARGLAAATEEVRRSLPERDELRDAPVAPEPAPPGSDSGSGWPVPWWVLLAVPAAALAWLTGVPLAKALRAHGRRRKPGAATVIGAWEEARDMLRAHGVPVSPGMTVRDLTTVAVAAQPLGDEATQGLRSLGAAVDVALWSGTEPGPDSGTQAWAAVRAMRKGLARRGLRARIRAAVNPAPLRPPR